VAVSHRDLVRCADNGTAGVSPGAGSDHQPVGGEVAIHHRASGGDIGGVGYVGGGLYAAELRPLITGHVEVDRALIDVVGVGPVKIDRALVASGNEGDGKLIIGGKCAVNRNRRDRNLDV